MDELNMMHSAIIPVAFTEAESDVIMAYASGKDLSLSHVCRYFVIEALRNRKEFPFDYCREPIDVVADDQNNAKDVLRPEAFTKMGLWEKLYLAFAVLRRNGKIANDMQTTQIVIGGD